jgi:hypothetical protein
MTGDAPDPDGFSNRMCRPADAQQLGCGDRGFSPRTKAGFADARPHHGVGDAESGLRAQTEHTDLADVLDQHVTFEIESIDRMYLNVYQPLLQYPRGAATFFHFHRGHTFASSALMASMTRAFVTAIGEFVDRHA